MNTKTIAWITGVLTLLLALSSFVLSFNALADLAARHKVSIPYLFPLVVEAGVIIFSLNALHRSLHGEHARWQWLLIIGSSLIAGSFNVLHAEPDLISRIMAAMPSLFLLLSFESFLNQLKRGVQRSTALKSLKQLSSELEQKQSELNSLIQTKQAELDSLSQEADALNSTVVQTRQQLEQLQAEIEQAEHVQSSLNIEENEAEQAGLSIEQRRTLLLEILANEGDIGATALSDKLNISRGTVYSDLKALNKAGLIVKNGHGWEVSQ